MGVSGEEIGFAPLRSIGAAGILMILPQQGNAKLLNFSASSTLPVPQHPIYGFRYRIPFSSHAWVNCDFEFQMLRATTRRYGVLRLYQASRGYLGPARIGLKTIVWSLIDRSMNRANYRLFGRPKSMDRSCFRPHRFDAKKPLICCTSS